MAMIAFSKLPDSSLFSTSSSSCRGSTNAVYRRLVCVRFLFCTTSLQTDQSIDKYIIKYVNSNMYILLIEDSHTWTHPHSCLPALHGVTDTHFIYRPRPHSHPQISRHTHSDYLIHHKHTFLSMAFKERPLSAAYISIFNLNDTHIYTIYGDTPGFSFTNFRTVLISMQA